MKKVISIALIFTMLLSSFNMYYGYLEIEELSTNNNSIILPIESHNEFKADMKSIDFSNQIKRFTIMEQKSIQQISLENLEKAKELILNINWDEYNLANGKEIYLNKIQQLIDENAIIDSYSIYLPKISNDINTMGSTSEYFGSIEGVDMLAIYDVYNRLYEPNYTGSGLTNWVNGAVNLAMCWVPYKIITIPFSLFSSYQPKYTVMSGDKVVAYTSEERTARTIFCKDIYGYNGIQNQYVGKLADMASVSVVNTVFISSSPYVDPYYEVTMPRQMFGTTNFFNQSATQREAYNNYINRREMTIYSLPAPYLRVE